MFGGPGNDVLRGGLGDDELTGEDGLDTFYGGTGADLMDGGAGSDIVVYIDATTALAFAMDGSFASAGEVANDTLTGIERIQGGSFADHFAGDGNANSLFGEGGIDILDGKAGTDVLRGGAAADNLTGGGGNDVFQYLALNELGDTITDFSASAAGNNDLFQFKGSVFAGLAAGPLAAANFVIRAADNLAQDANDFFIFRTSDTTLWFDPTGSASGAADAVMIANLQAAATMTFADIAIF